MFTLKTPQNLQNPSKKPQNLQTPPKTHQKILKILKKTKNLWNPRKTSKLYKHRKKIDPDYLEK